MEKKNNRILTRDESFNFRAAFWSDLHSLLYKALPSETVLWGQTFLSFCVSNGENRVTVKAKNSQSGEIIEVAGDLLVAADGCLSSIRQSFFPEHKLRFVDHLVFRKFRDFVRSTKLQISVRYSGYCAWRGILDFSDNEDSDTILGLKKAFPDLGMCLYFDLGSETHSVFYELTNKRINWIWYVNQPEPELKVCSLRLCV